MNLQQLRYFLETVDHGSFSAAAEVLHLAPPSVSEPVRRLEAELGLVLFERSGRRLRLTDSGAALVPHARHVIRAVGDAHEAMGELRSLRGGVATLGLFRNADYYDVPGAAAAFLAEHPGMRLRLFGQNSAEVAEAVRAGQAEAGLVVLPIIDDTLVVRPLLRDEVLYASAARPRTRQPPDVKALCEQKLVVYDAHYGATDPTRRQVLERVQQAGLQLEPLLEVERVETALGFVEGGIADTFAASSVLAALAPDLHVIGLDPPLFDTIAVITRRGAQLSPATRQLLAVAESRLRRLAHISSTVTAVEPT